MNNPANAPQEQRRWYPLLEAGAFLLAVGLLLGGILIFSPQVLSLPGSAVLWLLIGLLALLGATAPYLGRRWGTWWYGGRPRPKRNATRGRQLFQLTINTMCSVECIYIGIAQGGSALLLILGAINGLFALLALRDLLRSFRRAA